MVSKRISVGFKGLYIFDAIMMRYHALKGNLSKAKGAQKRSDSKY